MLPGKGRSLGSCKLRPGEKRMRVGVEQERTEISFSFDPPPPGQFDARSFGSFSSHRESEPSLGGPSKSPTKLPPKSSLGDSGSKKSSLHSTFLPGKVVAGWWHREEVKKTAT